MNKLNNHKDLGDVLIRSDLNVPMINNEITDKFRISKSINIINSIYESSRTITLQVILVGRIIVTQISHLLK